jgi:hypothetical protein
MGLNLVGAATGAQKVVRQQDQDLQEMLARAFAERQAEAQLELQRQAAARAEAGQAQNADQFNRRLEFDTTREKADEMYRQGQVDRQATQDRQGENERGVRRMIGEFLVQRGSQPLDAGSRQAVQGMALQEGVNLPDSVTADPAGDDARKLKLFEAQQRIEAKYRPPTQARDERIVQVMGKDGVPVWVRESQAVGQPAAQAARAVTGQERSVRGFLGRMIEAERNARSVEDKLTDRDFAAEWLPGATLENAAMSQSGQLYRQAQRMFTEARLRKESGAAIPQGEYDTDRDTNFRRPGDKPETTAQKRKARLEVMKGIGSSAGKALEEFYGPGTTIESLLAEFAEQAPQAPAGDLIWDPVKKQFVSQ